MAAAEKGSIVRLTAGTRVGFYAGPLGTSGGAGARYDWLIVGEDNWGEADLAACEFEISYVGMSHATMNGGGRDYEIIEVMTGTRARLRTTFQRPESATFRSLYATQQAREGQRR